MCPSSCDAGSSICSPSSALSPRQVFTRDQLLRHVWDSEPEWQGVGTVSEHVHRLRAKVEVDPARPRHIVTVRGVGYRFVP